MLAPSPARWPARLFGRLSFLDVAIGLVALALIGFAAIALHSAGQGISVTRLAIGETPALLYRPADAAPGPVVVVAHGFAGSQELMIPFATTLARNGFSAITFDFLGHGRNPAPLGGSITELTGATRSLTAETARVVAEARRLGDGRVLLLGHSMACDIIVRVADADPAIAGVVAVSMFSPAVTATAPKNLLVIVGEWEDFLITEALRATGLATAPVKPVPGVTYGDFAAGTARRVAIAPSVEHISVLYSRTAMDEALAWTNRVFGRPQAPAPPLDQRGAALAALFLGLVLLARPLSRFLPKVEDEPAGAGLGWKRALPVLLVPATVTPLLLRVVPTDFLPVLVGDYVAVHFLSYGLLTAAVLALVRGFRGFRLSRPGAFALATVLVTGYAAGLFGLAIDLTFTSFAATPARYPLIAATFIGTLAYFLAVEWATRGPGTGRFVHVAAKGLFLVSLAAAVVLDFERLFFLAIIVPAILIFFLIYGAFAAFAFRATGHPAVGALANAAAFAWALGVVFPILAG